MGNKDVALWAPQSMEQAMVVADRIANTNFVPKELRGKPDECLMAMMHGNEIGLSPVVALQSIAVINGKPSIWGDAALALVKSHPEFEDIEEVFLKEEHAARCTIKRRGQSPVVREFSWEQAKRAGLTGKNTYQQYPERMLQMRARSFAMRDAFPDALKGIGIAEETRDYPTEIRDAEGQETFDICAETRASLENVLTQAVTDRKITEEEKEKTLENAKKYTEPALLAQFREKVVEALAVSAVEEVASVDKFTAKADAPEEKKYDPAEDTALDLF